MGEIIQIETSQFVVIEAGEGLVVTTPEGRDHGQLLGLLDDDHPQYILRNILQAKGDLIGATAPSAPARIAAPASAGRLLRAEPAQATGVQWSDFLILEAEKPIGPNVGDYVEFWQYESVHLMPQMAWLSLSGGPGVSSLHIWFHKQNATNGAWRVVPPYGQLGLAPNHVLLQIAVGPNSNIARVRLQRQVADTAARNAHLVLFVPRVSLPPSPLAGSGNEAVVTTSIDTDMQYTSASLAHDHLQEGVPVRRLMAGTLASRPAAGQAGEVYYATDTRQLFFGTGTGWAELLPGAEHAARHAPGGADDLSSHYTAASHDHLSSGAAVRRLASGPLANRPAAGQAGEVYYATDTGQLFFGAETGWNEVMPRAVHAARHAPGGPDSLSDYYPSTSQALYLAWTGL